MDEITHLLFCHANNNTQVDKIIRDDDLVYPSQLQ